MNEQSLITRVNRLEKENRRMKLAGLLVLVGIAAVIVMGQAEPSRVAKVIEAEKFVLRDTSGITRAVLGTIDPSGWAGLILFDKNPYRRSISLGTPDPFLQFHTKEGNGVRVRLGATDTAMGLAVTDKNAAVGVSLGVLIHTKSYPALQLMDSNNQIRASFRLESSGKPSLSLNDTEGRSRATLGYTELETTGTGTVTKQSESSLVLFDKDGKVIWAAP